MSGILAPLKGKQISCTSGLSTGYAMVDSSGNPFTRYIWTGAGPFDSGWVSGYTAAKQSGYSAAWTSITVLNVYQIGGLICTASWPNN